MRQQDELQSIQRFIYASIPGNQQDKPTIFLKRPDLAQSRPYFKIDNPAGPTEILTPAWYVDKRVWVVTYFANDRSDAQYRGDLWRQKLFNDPRKKTLIPLWLFDFPYYPVTLYAVDDAGSTLPAGSYSVQVVAENDLGQLTKPSQVSTINLPTTGKSIRVQIPREPKGFPIGYKFHIYLSGSQVTPTSAHRVGSIAYTGRVDPLFTIANDVPNGTTEGNATALMSGLPASSEVRYRYLRVIPESIDTNLLEDPDKEGKFNYTVRFQTSAPGMREYTHSQILAGLHEAVQSS